jgi:TRAP-type C4-dicarboxylate transport system permease small subunit
VAEAGQASAPAGRPPLLYRVAEWFAAAGGVALVAALLVTVASVLSNDIFGRPILGDTEIVEMLMGIAVAAFMPWCQVRGANVIVDFFTMKFPKRLNDAIDAFAYIVFAVIVAVLTWRMIDGTITQYERERVSMFLKLPQWWGYALASIAAVLWVLVCLRTAWDRARSAFGPR